MILTGRQLRDARLRASFDLCELATRAGVAPYTNLAALGNARGRLAGGGAL